MGCCCVMVILIQTVKYQWPSNNLQLDIIITPPGKKKTRNKKVSDAMGLKLRWCLRSLSLTSTYTYSFGFYIKVYGLTQNSYNYSSSKNPDQCSANHMPCTFYHKILRDKESPIDPHFMAQWCAHRTNLNIILNCFCRLIFRSHMAINLQRQLICNVPNKH